ncbi:hypothetical protein GGF32_007134 [Allomyces javanicus]|nr:hypothetical protein GGF32_007134 [Allomyces javanicus]
MASTTTPLPAGLSVLNSHLALARAPRNERDRDRDRPIVAADTPAKDAASSLPMQATPPRSHTATPDLFPAWPQPLPASAEAGTPASRSSPHMPPLPRTPSATRGIILRSFGPTPISPDVAVPAGGSGDAARDGGAAKDILAPTPVVASPMTPQVAPVSTADLVTPAPAILSPPPAGPRTTPPTVTEKLSKMSWRMKRKLNSLLFSSHQTAAAPAAAPPTAAVSPVMAATAPSPIHTQTGFAPASSPPSTTLRAATPLVQSAPGSPLAELPDTSSGSTTTPVKPPANPRASKSLLTLQTQQAAAPWPAAGVAPTSATSAQTAKFVPWSSPSKPGVPSSSKPTPAGAALGTVAESLLTSPHSTASPIRVPSPAVSARSTATHDCPAPTMIGSHTTRSPAVSISSTRAVRHLAPMSPTSPTRQTQEDVAATTPASSVQRVPRERAHTTPVPGYHMVRRSSSTSLVLTKRASLRKRGSISSATRFGLPLPATNTTSSSLASSGPLSMPPSPCTPVHPNNPPAAMSAAASFLTQFGSVPPTRTPSVPASPMASSFSGVPASPAASFLAALNGGGGGASRTSSMHGDPSLPNSPQRSGMVPRQRAMTEAMLPWTTPTAVPSLPSSMAMQVDTCTNRTEYGDDEDDEDHDVFASVWESGFLVEEGDEIAGGYVVGAPLGSGATSTVHVATRTDATTGQTWKYALKVVIDRAKLPTARCAREPGYPLVPPTPHAGQFTGASPTATRVNAMPVGPGVGIGPRPHSGAAAPTSGVPSPAPAVDETNNPEDHQALDHEIAIWHRLHHRNIVDLCEVITTPECVFVFSELVTDGNLLQLVNEWDRLAASDGVWDLPLLLTPAPGANEPPRPETYLAAPRRARDCGLPEHWARRIARQLMDAIAYMHDEAKVYHRDVKLENVLVRFKHASSHVMTVQEITHSTASAASRSNGWRRVGSTTLGAMASASSAQTARGEKEVPLAVAAQWIASGAFAPVYGDGGAFPGATPQYWEYRTADNRVFRLRHHVQRRLLDMDVKLTDFGLSAGVDEACEDPEWSGGSLEYCPPESFDPVPAPWMAPKEKSIKKYLGARDVWSWAVCVYALVTGQLPFSDDYEPRLVMKIREFENLFPAPKPAAPVSQCAGAWGWGMAAQPARPSFGVAQGPRAMDQCEWDQIVAQATQAMAISGATLAAAAAPLAAHQGLFARMVPSSATTSATPSEDGHCDGEDDQVPARRPAVPTALPAVGLGIHVSSVSGAIPAAPAPTATNGDGIAVVYLPDQLARMVPEPSALWWAPNVSDRVSPPLEALFRDLFTAWEKRLVPREVLASEWMRV